MMEETTMEKVAFVIRNNSCFIVPPHIVVDKKDDKAIRFSVNGKCDKVTLMFPDGSIFSQQSPYFVILDKSPGNLAPKPHATLPLDQNAPPGVYRFTAYCEDTHSFAIGGSDGEIIIQT